MSCHCGELGSLWENPGGQCRRLALAVLSPEPWLLGLQFSPHHSLIKSSWERGINSAPVCTRAGWGSPAPRKTFSQGDVPTGSLGGRRAKRSLPTSAFPIPAESSLAQKQKEGPYLPHLCHFISFFHSQLFFVSQRHHLKSLLPVTRVIRTIKSRSHWPVHIGLILTCPPESPVRAPATWRKVHMASFTKMQPTPQAHVQTEEGSVLTCTKSAQNQLRDCAALCPRNERTSSYGDCIQLEWALSNGVSGNQEIKALEYLHSS